MTSKRQETSNKRNAAKSTGPKSTRGKGKVSRNALAHGLRSLLPVVPGEREQDWETHRAGVMASMGPVGSLETELAERVALTLWRLRRVATYETAQTSTAIEIAVEAIWEPKADPLRSPLDNDPVPVRLRKAIKERTHWAILIHDNQECLETVNQLHQEDDSKTINGETAGNVLEIMGGECSKKTVETGDDNFLLRLGIPEEEIDNPWKWKGWTVGLLRKGLRTIAEEIGMDQAKILAKTQRYFQETIEGEQDAMAKEQSKIDHLTPKASMLEQRTRAARAILDDPTMTKVMRYEAHLARQLIQTMNMLERLQATRGGQSFPPPAAGTILIEGGAPGPDLVGS